jgi:glycosyltransferase involved in cell wall biosynthesis
MPMRFGEREYCPPCKRCGTLRKEAKQGPVTNSRSQFGLTAATSIKSNAIVQYSTVGQNESLERAGHQNMEAQLLTILCPVHNEERVIPLFFERIRPVLAKLSERYSVDLVFLNNASTDGTLTEIEKVRQAWPATYVLTTSRNVGYHASLECGLRNSRGDLLVFIDVDCEDPPEMILQFAEKYEQGYDIVYGERADREEPPWLKSARRLFYRLLYMVADEEIVLDMAEFSLFTKEVRDAIVNENTSFPFLRASIGRVGFRRAAIPFKRHKRIGGSTHYNLLGLSIFAIAGILSSSTLFLRLPIFFFPLWILGLLSLGIGYIETKSVWYLLAGIIVFAGYVGATLAFTALYVARTYKNGLHRPNAFVDHGRSLLPPNMLDPRPDRTTSAAGTMRFARSQGEQ